MRINPRELRHKIEVQREIDGTDKENRPVPKWTTILKIKSKVINVGGEELEIANGVGVKFAKTFYIRFRRSIEIKESDRILYKGKQYNIRYINDIEEKGRYLEIKTEYIE
ncbi:phage head closure protein [Clostridium perfringens]|uniref:phage head closure protein n=1 Tax=Clostridium perfringens TaxID=1502 RepID=UPI00189C0717|nr:phage head closure protein [Clostridium perfringens]